MFSWLPKWTKKSAGFTLIYQEYKNWTIWQPSPTPFLKVPFRYKRDDLRSLEPENDTTDLQKK